MSWGSPAPPAVHRPHEATYSCGVGSDGDQGYFGPDSVSWQVHRQVTVLFGSAENGNGILRLLKALRHEAPFVAVTAKRLGVGTVPSCAYVLKTFHTAHGGKTLTQPLPQRGCDFRRSQSTLQDLLSGQYNDPVRIIAFNTREGWSRDVSHEIAVELGKTQVGARDGEPELARDASRLDEAEEVGKPGLDAGRRHANLEVRMKTGPVAAVDADPMPVVVVRGEHARAGQDDLHAEVVGVVRVAGAEVLVEHPVALVLTRDPDRAAA